MAAAVWAAMWPAQRIRQREFFEFGMEVLLKLDLAETRDFFSAFFSLSDFHWHGFLSSRLSFTQVLARAAGLALPCLRLLGAVAGVYFLCALAGRAAPAGSMPSKCGWDMHGRLHARPRALPLTRSCPLPPCLHSPAAAHRLWAVAVRALEQRGAHQPAAEGAAGAGGDAGPAGQDPVRGAGSGVIPFVGALPVLLDGPWAHGHCLVRKPALGSSLPAAGSKRSIVAASFFTFIDGFFASAGFTPPSLAFTIYSVVSGLSDSDDDGAGSAWKKSWVVRQAHSGASPTSVIWN